MEIRHRDLIIDSENPFENCKLERRQYAHILTTIVESYAEGFVLAINNKWGTGKTTFVKMWEKHLQNSDFMTMHFNAWENDFEMEPLTAMLGELKKLIGKKEDKTFESLIEKGAVISKKIIPAITKYFAKKYLGDEAVDMITSSAEAATEILNDEVNDYINKKEKLEDFKTELEIFIKDKSNDKPIVFIIDELDRCRPDYAVEVLEKVKHFFSVPGIVFVLSIDKEQLSYAIQGYYGSANIDTDEYLRRFIDIEYQLPDPSIEAYTEYLFEYYGFDEFFKKRSFTNESREDKEEFIRFSTFIANEFHYTLRQQEKLFAQVRIILRTFYIKNSCFPDLVLMLIHLKFFHENLFDNIKKKKLTTQSLVDKIESLFKFDFFDENINRLVSVEALLVYMYHKYITKEKRLYGNSASLFKKVDNSDEKEFLLSSKTIDIPESTFLHYNLEKHIEHIIKIEHEYYSMDLSFFLNKIELLDNLEID